jgi:hypothetical protein
MGITQITQEVNNSQNTPWKKKKYLSNCKKRGEDFCFLLNFLLKNPP